jgi:GAF domain-containing protein
MEGRVIMQEPKRNYYQSLYEIATAVNSAGEPDAVLHSVVENVTRAVGAKGCSLMLLRLDRRLLVHAVAHGLSDEFIRKGLVSADESIPEALEGKPVAILDVTEDERIQYPQATRKEGIASILCVPVRHRGEIVGVIRVYTSEPYHFTEDDIYFVSAVGNLGAIALENAKRYNRLREGYEAFRQLIF